jgi:hypothetical protein
MKEALNDTLIAYITAGFSFVGFVVTLMIKVNQAEVKKDLAVHKAITEQKFERIDEKFEDVKDSLRTIIRNGHR